MVAMVAAARGEDLLSTMARRTFCIGIASTTSACRQARLAGRGGGMERRHRLRCVRAAMLRTRNSCDAMAATFSKRQVCWAIGGSWGGRPLAPGLGSGPEGVECGTGAGMMREGYWEASETNTVRSGTSYWGAGLSQRTWWW